MSAAVWRTLLLHTARLSEHVLHLTGVLLKLEPRHQELLGQTTDPAPFASQVQPLPVEHCMMGRPRRVTVSASLMLLRLWHS